MEIDGPLARVKDLPDNLTATRTRGPLGSAFDRVRIINLRRRGDRRAETLGELVAFNNYLMIGMAPLMLLGNTLNAATLAVDRLDGEIAARRERIERHAPCRHGAR